MNCRVHWAYMTFEGIFWLFFGHNFFHINVRKKLTCTLWIIFLRSFQPSNQKVSNSSRFWEIERGRTWCKLATPKLYPKFDPTFLRSSPQDILAFKVCFVLYSWEHCPKGISEQLRNKNFTEKILDQPPGRMWYWYVTKCGHPSLWALKMHL